MLNKTMSVGLSRMYICLVVCLSVPVPGAMTVSDKCPKRMALQPEIGQRKRPKYETNRCQEDHLPTVYVLMDPFGYWDSHVDQSLNVA